MNEREHKGKGKREGNEKTVIESDEILSVQIAELSAVTKLRWDGTTEQIQVEVSERSTMNE